VRGADGVCPAARRGRQPGESRFDCSGPARHRQPPSAPTRPGPSSTRYRAPGATLSSSPRVAFSSPPARPARPRSHGLDPATRHPELGEARSAATALHGLGALFRRRGGPSPTRSNKVRWDHAGVEGRRGGLRLVVRPALMSEGAPARRVPPSLNPPGGAARPSGRRGRAPPGLRRPAGTLVVNRRACGALQFQRVHAPCPRPAVECRLVRQSPRRPWRWRRRHPPGSVVSAGGGGWGGGEVRCIPFAGIAISKPRPRRRWCADGPACPAARTLVQPPAPPVPRAWWPPTAPIRCFAGSPGVAAGDRRRIPGRVSPELVTLVATSARPGPIPLGYSRPCLRVPGGAAQPDRLWRPGRPSCWLPPVKPDRALMATRRRRVPRLTRPSDVRLEPCGGDPSTTSAEWGGAVGRTSHPRAVAHLLRSALPRRPATTWSRSTHARPGALPSGAASSRSRALPPKRRPGPRAGADRSVARHPSRGRQRGPTPAVCGPGSASGITGATYGAALRAAQRPQCRRPRLPRPNGRIRRGRSAGSIRRTPFSVWCSTFVPVRPALGGAARSFE